MDSSTPMWDLFVSISAFWAKQERERIGQRIRAGQARAHARGVKFGRKPRLVDVEELRRAGCGPGLAPDRQGDEGLDLDPPAAVERVPKVPCGPEARGAALGGGFRGARGGCRALKVSA